ncbi:NAD(P)H-dependent oxidoreductase subunit E [Candidatus Gracilibacteria bacterium]|nr:NAD(P)H-dependent oxidoreductase subunit E [Candidatus Gracilibacteria bacterium]
MKVKVCGGKACSSIFSNYIVKRIEGDVERLGLKKIELEDAKCMGMCKKGPNVKFDDDVMNYAEPAKVSERMIKGPKKAKKKYNKK